MKKALFFAILLTFFSCKKDAPEENWAGIQLPAHFPSIVQDIEVNSITFQQFKLGRKLFFDPILSIDSSISCQSCHQQESSFSHTDHDLSHGIFDKLGTRNSIAIQNLLWHKEYFWDGGVHHINLITPNPIENELEMGETMAGVLLKLNRNPTYRKLFKEAYGKDEIDINIVLRAFSAYQAALISASSKFDDYLKGNKNALTAEEIKGYRLFEAKCGTCHSGALLSDFDYRNNGLDATNNKDIGRGGITLKEADKGKFKTPSLRNISITAPYMHDGRLKTLEQVLEHYRNGIKPNPNLDPTLRNGIQMTDLEKQQIIQFLHTLKDQKFITDKSLHE